MAVIMEKIFILALQMDVLELLLNFNLHGYFCIWELKISLRKLRNLDQIDYMKDYNWGQFIWLQGIQKMIMSSTLGEVSTELTYFELIYFVIYFPYSRKILCYLCYIFYICKVWNSSSFKFNKIILMPVS